MQRLHTDSGGLGNCARLERILTVHDHDVLIWDYRAGPWSSALSFCGDRKTRLPLSVWTGERHFRVPIASHVDLDFGSVPAGRIRPFDCAASVHLHTWHVHVCLHFDVANIDKLIVGIAEFD